jgi:hypothetical protein
VCGRAPEDGDHVSCIEIYAQSMQSTDDAPVPPARIDITCESVVVVPLVALDRVTCAERAHAQPVQLSPPFKVPIA